MLDEQTGVAKTPCRPGVAKTPYKRNQYLVRGFGNTPESPHGGFTCPKYDPIAGQKRCKHYLANGACALPSEFMCVEWLKRNGHPYTLGALQECVQAPRAPFPHPELKRAPERSGAQFGPVQFVTNHSRSPSGDQR